MERLKQIHTKIIPEGWKGTEETLKHMVAYANKAAKDPFIYKLAREIIKDTPEGDHLAEIVAIFNWVKASTRWTRDIVKVTEKGEVEGVETLTYPTILLKELHGEGDCDCISTLLAALLGSIGIEWRFKVIKKHGDEDFSHVYVIAKTDGKWIPLDASVASIEDKPAGWEYKNPKEALIYPKLGELKLENLQDNTSLQAIYEALNSLFKTLEELGVKGQEFMRHVPNAKKYMKAGYEYFEWREKLAIWLRNPMTWALFGVLALVIWMRKK